MKFYKLYFFFLIFSFNLSISLAQTNEHLSVAHNVKKEKKKKKKKKKKYKLPDIDLTHWKVTVPIGKAKKATSVEPPEIFDYANNEVLKPFMYNDSTKGAIVFHAYPASTTANTKYSRSELREQMVSGENNVNWTFEEGGNMKAKMAIDEISRDENGKYHRVIIAQIHGRLTNEQRDRIGQKDNNAPPILKVYWDKGKIRVKTKILKSQNVAGDAILHKEAWDDDKGRNFEQEVGFKKFTLEVDVKDGKMVVSLNNQEFFTYDDLSIKKWNVFENYFKVGNYFQSRDKGSYAKVRLYDLEVSH